jgi:hypothetical protein
MDLGIKDWILPSISADRRTILAREYFMATTRMFGDGKWICNNQLLDR